MTFVDFCRIAFEINVQITRRIISICKRISNLDALVHISTGINYDQFKYKVLFML